ncbi:MAG: hypothetical protein HRU11_10085 [Parvularculaceae bacterium]|nr:hypothetical protein [Parvularculaceae bacterium]
MTEQISIASLIKRQPTQHEDASSSSELPPALKSSQSLWDGLATRLGEKLTELLEVDVQASVSLSMTTELALREQFSSPGVLIPTDLPVKESFFLVPGDGAKTLATLLLKSSAIDAEDDDTASDQDGLLITEVLSTLSGLSETAFGRPLISTAKNTPLTDWPLQAPSPQDRLLVKLELSIEKHSDCMLLFAFGNDQVTDFEHLLDQSANQIQSSQVYLRIEGVLSRWHADQSELSTISPGDRLLIPGGHLDDVLVELRGSDMHMGLGQAELGTTRGRHALKVKSVSLRP